MALNPNPSKIGYADEWNQFEMLALGGQRQRILVDNNIPEARKTMDNLLGMLKMFETPVDGIVSKVYDSDAGVRVKVYKPENMKNVTRVGMYIHGGGFCMGTVEHEDSICRQLAKSIPAGIVSVEHRLAPEHPFPAPLDDCWAVWKWIQTTSIPRFFAPSGLPVPDNLRTFVIGCSSGGNLALNVALRAVGQSAVRPPDAVFALHPAVLHWEAMQALPENLRRSYDPAKWADAAVLETSAMEGFYNYYIKNGEAAKPTDPLVSPVLHENLTKLPPVYITTGDMDPTSVGALILHDRLVEAHGKDSSKVALKEYNGYPHQFFAVPVLQQTDFFYTDLAKAVQTMCV